MSSSFLDTAYGIGAIAGAAAAAATFTLAALSPLWRRWRMRHKRDQERHRRMLTDWEGSPARPGVPAQPGVMERLAAVEHTQEVILAQLLPNGGQSVADKVDRIERYLSAQRDRQIAQKLDPEAGG